MEETTAQKKVTAYGKKLESQIVIQKKMLHHLESKTKLLEQIFEGLDEDDIKTNSTQQKLAYHQSKIDIIKTNGEIDVLKRVLEEKVAYYNKYITKFEENISELERNWDKIFKLANNSTNPNVQKLMASIHWNKVDTDDDAKIEAYRLLKKFF
jgi:hypothetical protein